MDGSVRRQRGFTLIEILISATIVVLAAMMGVMHVIRTRHHLEWSRDKSFARSKAVSILDELRAYVEGGEGEVAADLDGFDDGVSESAVLSITPDPTDPGAFVAPDHPVSGNNHDAENWRWFRRITVRPFAGIESRDLRIVTIRMFRLRDGDVAPGEQMAEVSSVIRTVGDAYPSTQVYDVYLLALENVPGWWVYMDAIQPFIEATLTDLEGRNRGLKFRTHWITKLGYGRDEEYAPYTNEVRSSTATTRWTYVYPGRMPDGESAVRYYVPGRMGARVNIDGDTSPIFANDLAVGESYFDANGNGMRDAGESYTDSNGNGEWDTGNPVPYALPDMHNHCKRWPAANATFDARVSAGVDKDDEPTWRLLLDEMVADPDRFHNAILINLHGELLPMPPARNVSDAAKDPTTRPGWRAVAHPELLRPRRVEASDALSQTPRFRVYAYKTEFLDTEMLTTQEEPFLDVNRDGIHDAGESFQDWNGNGVRDVGLPISVVVRDGDFSWAPNDSADPSIRVRCLSGGIDADGSGVADPYEDWRNAPRYPEAFTDVTKDGIRQLQEPWLDLNGDGIRQSLEPYQELDGDGVWTPMTEALDDVNGNGSFDPAGPAETWTDANGNGRWDAAEPYWDMDGNGSWTPPLHPVTPWKPWNPADLGDPIAMLNHYKWFGEPFHDVDGDTRWDGAESFFDANQNGVRDGGFERGEMWFESAYDPASGNTTLFLHGTPLTTPQLSSDANRGLRASQRLYDLDYIPCPTPAAADGTDRFARDLYDTGSSVPKNTARWTIELPLTAVRRGFETGTGANDGDATDRIVTVDTRFGRDLTTGTMWPVRRHPSNCSTTYAYFYSSAEDVPFSERYQFLGDPRHSPYADTDAQGATARHGYNWYFDDFRDSTTSAQGNWLAFDGSRLRDGWKGRASSHDFPRIASWFRSAIVQSEAVYSTLTGFSYYYLSVGGDIGYDSANGFSNSIPMDGRPFGLSGDVYENTITNGGGTSSIKGSCKYVRSNDGSTQGVRNGGYWWSKPWLGELCQDSAYVGQWSAWGNLRANSGTTSGEYHLVRRGDVTTSQQPAGTDLQNRYARLADEGCTSIFNIGSSSRTFHHQYADGQSGSLVGDGIQLADNYNFPMPNSSQISRPFGLSTSYSGGVGDEFNYTGEYPRYSAQMVRTFYNHQGGQTGSGLVRLSEPGVDPRAGYIVVNGIDKTLETGSAFIARYSVLSLIHSFFAGGVPGSTNRVRQLPRVEIQSPTLITELEDPAQIELRWNIEWNRWDGLPYTESYPSTFAEDESELVYVPLYSRDGGSTWLNMRDESPAELGRIPWIDGVGVDTARILTDMQPDADESWLWVTPRSEFPQGSYLIRVEVYRASESLHYAHHVEKIYVNR